MHAQRTPLPLAEPLEITPGVYGLSMASQCFK